MKDTVKKTLWTTRLDAGCLRTAAWTGLEIIAVRAPGRNAHDGQAPPIRQALRGAGASGPPIMYNATTNYLSCLLEYKVQIN
eukprot:scaffold132159_cov50-Attheya_sp.AAC.1